jgi:hypothetical protein
MPGTVNHTFKVTPERILSLLPSWTPPSDYSLMPQAKTPHHLSLLASKIINRSEGNLLGQLLKS